MQGIITTIISLLISGYSATTVFADINLKHIEYFEGTCELLVIEDKELEGGENFLSSRNKMVLEVSGSLGQTLITISLHFLAIQILKSNQTKSSFGLFMR